MKIVLIFFIFLSTIGTSKAQKNPYFFALTGMKELGIMNPNYPWVLTGTAKFSVLFAQAEYGFAPTKQRTYQLLEKTNNSSLRFGIAFGGDPEGEFKSGQFYGGIENIHKYKNLHYDSESNTPTGSKDFPTDQSGDPVLLDKVAVGFRGQQYLIGIQIISVGEREESCLEDAYDTEKGVNKTRYSVITGRFEIMYLPSPKIDSTFAYSPYGQFVPRYVAVPETYKFKHLGLRVRFDVTFSGGIGMMVQMGITPGMKKASEYYNDFRLDLQGGIFYQLSKYRKQ